MNRSRHFVPCSADPEAGQVSSKKSLKPSDLTCTDEHSDVHRKTLSFNLWNDDRKLSLISSLKPSPSLAVSSQKKHLVSEQSTAGEGQSGCADSPLRRRNRLVKTLKHLGDQEAVQDIDHSRLIESEEVGLAANSFEFKELDKISCLSLSDYASPAIKKSML